MKGIDNTYLLYYAEYTLFCVLFFVFFVFYSVNVFKFVRRPRATFLLLWKTPPFAQQVVSS